MGDVLSAEQVQEMADRAAFGYVTGRNLQDIAALARSHEQLRENGKAISDLAGCYRVQAQEAEEDLREQVAITETWIVRAQVAEAAVRAGGNAADALRDLVNNAAWMLRYADYVDVAAADTKGTRASLKRARASLAEETTP